jgi:hypothetical protein
MKPDWKLTLLACGALLATTHVSAQSALVRPIDLIKAVPLLTDSGRAGYGRFLKTAIRPRAFALNMNGDWAWNAGDHAIGRCARRVRGARTSVPALCG